MVGCQERKKVAIKVVRFKLKKNYHSAFY